MRLDDEDRPERPYDHRLRAGWNLVSGRPAPSLSSREKQLIALATEGHTDTSIAQHLGISEATVGTYWGRIRVKLGPYSRTELVSIVIRAEQADELARLKVANAELARQLNVSSADSEGLFRQFVESAADSILITNSSSVIVTANAAAHELFGYPPGELVGANMSVLIPQRFRERHAEVVQGFLQAPSKGMMGDHFDAPALRRDGTEMRIRAALSVISTPDGPLTMSIHRAVGSEAVSVSTAGSAK